MALLCVLIYISLIAAFGCFFLRNWKIDPVLLFLTGFMIGSVLIGGAMFLLVNVGLISPIPVCLLCIVILVLGVFGASTAFRSIKAIKGFIISQVYLGDYRLIFLIFLIAGLVFYLVMAYAPPRSADAMIYHLAQMKDIVKHEGFIYRPYCGYNYPQYFHYLFIPVFMVVGGLGVQIAVYFYFVLVIFSTLYMSFKTKQTKQLLLLALFLVFMPVCTRQATTVTNDFPVIFYVLIGFLLILERYQIRNLIFAYISFGFALGSKYQAVLYFPLFILATLIMVRGRWKSPLKYAVIIPTSFIPFLVASPFFIRNFYYIGAPFWPFLQDLFNVKKDYLYLVAQNFNLSQQGHFSLMTLARSIVSLIASPWIISIIWALCIGYYFTRFPVRAFYKIGTLLYFLCWFLLQPRIYNRFAIYIVPIAAVMAISFCEWFYNKFSSHLGKLPYAMTVLSIIIGIGFSILYSVDITKYQINRDLEEYHEATWFYKQHQWINHNLGDDGKVLVIVSHPYTYYIDKEYLCADPWTSGLIDWLSIKDVEELKNVLHKLQVRYIFFEDLNWNQYPGGSNMMRLIDELKKDKYTSTLLSDNNVKIITQRMLRKFYITKIFLLELQNWKDYEVQEL